MQIDRNNIKWIVLALILVLVLILATHHGCQKRFSNHQEEPTNAEMQIIPLDKVSSPINIYDNTETQITFHGKANHPVIYDNIIVWEDERERIPGAAFLSYNHDIYMYDLVNKVETRITTDISQQTDPAIYGNNIVWTDFRNRDETSPHIYDGIHNYDIYMCNLDTKIETRITTNSSSQCSPAISDQAIVWQDYRNGNWDIYMYNLDTGITTQVTTNNKDQRHPDISGQTIIWIDYRNDSSKFGCGEIYSYDIRNGIETQITIANQQECRGSASIYNNKIVYGDYNSPSFGYSSNLYIYDLATKTEKQIISKDHDMMIFYEQEYLFDIYDNKIVWSGRDTRDTTPNITGIYMYDLDTGIKTEITTNNASQVYPAIHNNRIVWIDRHFDEPPIGMDVYFYKFTD